MTIHLPESLENPIRDAVDRGRFTSFDDAMAEAARLLVTQLSQPAIEATPPNPNETSSASRPKRIWEVAEELRKSVPDEEWDKLPVDGAEQHDHYIYGTPKRPAKS